jgi:hypothetical protein
MSRAPSPDRFILGLTGAAGAGKDSVAAALAWHGYRSIALGDALRAEVAQAWRVDTRLFTERATKETRLPSLAVGMCCETDFLAWAIAHGIDLHEPRSPRWVQQRWGQDYRRARCPTYWGAVVERWLRYQLAAGRRHLVVTDVREPVDAAMIHALGGVLLRVHRPDLPALVPDTARHSSERQGQLEVDGEIINDGSLEALRVETERVVLGLLGAQALRPTASLALHESCDFAPMAGGVQ